MPTTYNGIGTHYYGKKNLQKRAANCPHCGNKVELSSYDTRLWFVIVFIPIVPLGRKRIVDSCPACTRHYAVEADKWETSKQLEISGAQDKFRSSQSPEDAMALHQQLMTYHQLDQAAEFRKAMCEKFPDNAKVHAYLGASLEHFGKLDEADEVFRRALELRADMPEARIGVAHALIRAGQIDEARRMLDFLETPGAGQLYDMEPLNKLAQACQQANRHEEALTLFAVIQRELPHIAELGWFRKFVKQSEKALKRKESQLPRQKFSWKRLFQSQQGTGGEPQLTWKSLLIVGVIVAVVLLGFVVANEYTRRHRTLHIVNGYPHPASVRISGVEGVHVIHSTGEVKLAEGRYHASVSGAVTEELDFEVRSGYFDRWFDDPAWVLNPGGKAVLIRNEVTYSRDEVPPRVTVHFGKPFEKFGNITHPFRDLPESLRMKSGESRTLVGLQVHQGEGADISAYFASIGENDSAMKFSEMWLKSNPGDTQVLQLYVIHALGQEQTNRMEIFLRAGLSVRPVRTEWHRAYQKAHDKSPDHAALVAQYQAMLADDPDNSALLYLCGRLEGDRARSVDYFERSQRADPSNAYPVFALGYANMAVGDWAEARRQIGRAVELNPDNAAYGHSFLIARLAVGEMEEVEKELRDEIRRDPASHHANQQLIEILARQQKRDEVFALCQQFSGNCVSQYGQRGPIIARAMRCHALYVLGDFAELEKFAGNSGNYRFQAFVEQGRIADALKLLPPGRNDDEAPITSLALSLAFRREGNIEQADHWVERARSVLARGDEDDVAAARLLALEASKLTIEEAKNVVMQPRFKSVLVAHLAQLNSPARAELTVLARSLNVERSFPYHLIQRVTAPKQ